MCSWRQRMVKVWAAISNLKITQQQQKHLKSQHNIYSTTTRYIYLGKFIHHMTENLFFITPRYPPLPLPLFQHPMTHDLRLLPEHTHDDLLLTVKRQQSSDDIFYEIATINSKFLACCMLKLLWRISFSQQRTLPRLGEALTQET